MVPMSETLAVDKSGDTHTRGIGFRWQDSNGDWWIEAEAAEDIGSAPTASVTNGVTTWTGGNSGIIVAIDEDGKFKQADYAELGGATPKRGYQLGVADWPTSSSPYEGRPMVDIETGDVCVFKLTGTVTLADVAASAAANAVCGILQNSSRVGTAGTKIEIDGLNLRTAQPASNGSNADVQIWFPKVADVQT